MLVRDPCRLGLHTHNRRRQPDPERRDMLVQARLPIPLTPGRAVIERYVPAMPLSLEERLDRRLSGPTT